MTSSAKTQPLKAPKLLTREEQFTPRKLRTFLRSVEEVGSITAACGEARIFSRNMERRLMEGRTALEAGTHLEPANQATAWLVLMTEQARSRFEARMLRMMQGPALSNPRFKALGFMLERILPERYRPQAEVISTAATRLMLSLQARGADLTAELSLESGAAASLPGGFTPARDSGSFLSFSALPSSLLALPDAMPAPSGPSAPARARDAGDDSDDDE